METKPGNPNYTGHAGVLHGNAAKLSRRGGYVPRFTNMIGASDRYDEEEDTNLYNRLGDDAQWCRSNIDDISI